MTRAFYGQKVFKGRRTTSNVVGRFERNSVEQVSDGWYEEELPTHIEETVSPDSARTVITSNDSPDVGFELSINPYRGCSHACPYCFARPSHSYLGLNVGEDFERKLVVKVNAVERVRAELRSPKWNGDPIAMGTNTDPYQRAEGRYHLTRGSVEALRG